MDEGAPVEGASRERRVRRSLMISLIDAALCAVMVGVSESFFGALAVTLGHDDAALALLTTLPLLCAALAQLGAGWLVDLCGGRKRLVIAAVTVQALSHLGFLAIAVTGERSLLALMAVKLLFWISGTVAAPAWCAWMAALTEGVERERYFAWRSGLVQLAILVSFTGAGWFLARAVDAGLGLQGFAVLQAVGLVARGLSGVALAAQEDLPAPARAQPVSFVRRARQALVTGRWGVAVTLAMLMFGAHLSVPFYTPYMLKTLRLNLDDFALLISVAILAKALTFPFWHRATGLVGLGPVLFLGGVGVALVAFLWAAVSSFQGLIVAQLVSGVAWGALEFSSFQLLLSSADEECRIEFLSIASCLTGTLQLLGALAGGFLLYAFALDYRDLFAISALGRLIPLTLLLIEARGELRNSAVRLFWRVLSVRPSGGFVGRPILTSPTLGGAAPPLAPAALGVGAAAPGGPGSSATHLLPAESSRTTQPRSDVTDHEP